MSKSEEELAAEEESRKFTYAEHCQARSERIAVAVQMLDPDRINEATIEAALHWADYLIALVDRTPPTMNNSIISKLEQALARVEAELPLRQEASSFALIQAPAEHLQKILDLLHAVQLASAQQALACTVLRSDDDKDLLVCGRCHHCKINLALGALVAE